jgi:hypothetical protein
VERDDDSSKSRQALVNDEVARMQVGDMNVHQRYAVVIAEVDYRIVATIRRLKQGLRLAALRFI